MVEFCSPLSLIITHVGTLPSTSTHSHPCPAPQCPNILLCSEEPIPKRCGHCQVRRGCPGRGPERELLTEGSVALVLLFRVEGLCCPGAQGWVEELEGGCQLAQ